SVVRDWERQAAALASYDLHAVARGSQTGSTVVYVPSEVRIDSGLGPSREPAGACSARPESYHAVTRGRESAAIASAADRFDTSRRTSRRAAVLRAESPRSSTAC